MKSDWRAFFGYLALIPSLVVLEQPEGENRFSTVSTCGYQMEWQDPEAALFPWPGADAEMAAYWNGLLMKAAAPFSIVL